MARTRDLYEVLEVSRDAAAEEIKRAYRRLAREWHPDVNQDPGAEQRFKEINLAYQTLSDPVKRRQYDLFGGEGFTPDMFDFTGDIADIFEMFFGSAFRRSGARAPRTLARRGQDLRLVLDLTFEEAAFGVAKDVRVETLGACGRCGGTGAAEGTAPATCSTCGGSGQLSDVRRTVFGTLMQTRTCPACEGSGKEIASPCPECRGSGRVAAVDEIEVEVPAGVAHGMELRIEGRGEAGRNGGPPGDLYVTLRVPDHPLFERRGQHLVCTLEIPVTQALLGTTVTIPTLDGEEAVKIPAGTRSGEVVRFRGRGLPHPGGGRRGDLYVEIDVDIPARLSKKERAAVEALADLRDERPGEGTVRGTLRPRG
ncbi:MAG: molecular chaperone DnaJ [Actinomycetota bacterium]